MAYIDYLPTQACIGVPIIHKDAYYFLDSKIYRKNVYALSNWILMQRAEPKPDGIMEGPEVISDPTVEFSQGTYAPGDIVQVETYMKKYIWSGVEPLEVLPHLEWHTHPEVLDDWIDYGTTLKGSMFDGSATTSLQKENMAYFFYLRQSKLQSR